MMLFERDPLVTDVREGSNTGPSSGPRGWTLKLWSFVVAMVHFDRGACTVAAMGVTDDFPIHGYGLAVSLLAWHSLGLAVGNSLASAYLQQVSAKLAMVLSLGVLTISNFSLGMLETGVASTSLLRFVSGLAAACPLVYLPLWVDEYAGGPSGGNMSQLLHGTCIGHLFGVVTGSSQTGWRGALVTQSCLLFMVLVGIATVPLVQVDIPSRIQTARLDCLNLQGAESSGVQNLLREMRDMIQGMNRNPLTLSLSCVLCILHAIGATLLLWFAPYLYLSAGAPKVQMITVSLCAMLFTTVPMIGSYVGLILCDRMDGLKAGMHSAALRLASAFALLGASCGPLNAAAEGFFPRFLLLCLWLFSIGAVLPICCALLMTSMPSYLRSFNATAMFLALHFFSFTVSPLAVAFLMGFFVLAPRGLQFGVSLAFWATTVAALLLIVTYAREPKSSGTLTSLSGVDDLTVSDVNYELSRRRISTVPL